MSYGTSITASLPSWGQVQWSGSLNTVLYAITGTLAQAVTPSGMDIVANLDMQGNAMAGAGAAVLVPDADTGLPRSLFFANTGSLVVGELYLRDGSNRTVQVTSSGSVSAASAGGFGGNYASSGALAAFSSSNSTYYFTVAGSQYLLGNFNGANATFGAPVTGILNLAQYGNFVTSDGDYALIESTSPGTPSTVASGTVTRWDDVAKGRATSATSSQYSPGPSTFGWFLTKAASTNGGSVDFPLRYVQGDQLQSIVFTTAGGTCTGTLNSLVMGALAPTVMPIATIISTTGVPTTMSNGATSVTGTLPYSTNGTGTLFLSVQCPGPASVEIYNIVTTWSRKLV